MRNTAFDKALAFTLMRKLGIVRAEVEYSGGNDDGGVNDIRIFRGPGADDPNGVDDTTGEQLEEYSEGELEYNVRTDRWKPKTPKTLTDQDRLAQQLCAPVYEEWGSFAGEFYVSGKLVFDAATQKVTKGQDVETPSSEYSEEDL